MARPPALAARVGQAARRGTGGSRQATRAGGTLTVLEGAAFAGDWSQGLDPATNASALANGTLMDAIYGELFEIGMHNRLVRDLATGYRFSNGAKRLTIHLRRQVRFSDGTPFDAKAVVYNFRRDLAGESVAKPAWPALSSMTAPNPSTVVLRFKAPDGAAVNQFQDSNVNWIASPAALRKRGAKAFALRPVGAGPFEVLSDSVSHKLTLKKNPGYWQKGRPYLSGLVFETVTSDEQALEDLRAGGAQAYEYMTSPQLLSAFRSAGFTVTTDPGTAPADVLVNTAVAPFTSLAARKALYYATDSAAVDKGVFGGTCPLTQSFTGPGGLFYDPRVPGYPTYNPARARKLVRKLGGLDFTLFYTPLQATVQTEATALQSMWDAVGMHVKLLKEGDLSADIQELESHKWQATTANLGSWDPAGATGPAFRLESTSPFSGVSDAHLDSLLAGASAARKAVTREQDYQGIARYLAAKAYTPLLCTPASFDISVKGVSGPGLTSVTAGSSSGPLVLWEDVSTAGKAARR